MSSEDTAAARARLVHRIGHRIRELRRNRMTLAQLAQASNVSIGLLSRLENGVGNPTFAALGSIARALDVGVYAFFESPSDAPAVVRGADRVTLRRTPADPELELLAPSFSSRIVGVLMTLPPGCGPDALSVAGSGRQYEIVVSGPVRYRIEHEVHDLETGDFIVFETGRPHARHNPSDTGTARILCFATEARLGTYFPGESATE
ncbi:helix-turn-helix domain-containing protein [Nocardia sp. N2S4-5]|uniref:helix-turn-helix domain-containing protein n=1 Tax=Nocardia sp. N2S4-5 TaxID=3351565 RepID=UPI0037CF7687